MKQIKNFQPTEARLRLLIQPVLVGIKLLNQKSFSCSQDERVRASDVFNPEALNVRLGVSRQIKMVSTGFFSLPGPDVPDVLRKTL